MTTIENVDDIMTEEITEEVQNAEEHTESTNAGSTGGYGGEGVAEPTEGVEEAEAIPEAEGEDHPASEDVPVRDISTPSVSDDAVSEVAKEEVGTPDIMSDLPLCETEDSDNCFWDAQTQGNGQGHSFYVIDGEVFYTNSEPDTVFNDEGWLKQPPADLETVCAEDNTWWECELIENTEPINVVELPVQTEAAVSVPTAQPQVLAETGATPGPALGVAAAVFVCIGLALIVSKLVKNRKAVA